MYWTSLLMMMAMTIIHFTVVISEKLNDVTLMKKMKIEHIGAMVV